MLGSVRASDTAFAGGMKTSNQPDANTLALQAALDTGKNVCIDIKGAPRIAPGLRAKAWGQTVFGQGPYQTVLDCRGDGDYFHNNGQHGFSVRDLSFTGNAGGAWNVNSGAAIVFDGTDTTIGTGGQIIGGDVSNLRILGMWNGIWTRDINTLTVNDVEMAGMWGDFGYAITGLDANQRTDLVRLTLTKYSPAAVALAAGRGTALYVDGYVQTIDLMNFIAVRPLRGVYLGNSQGFGMGMRPAFLTAMNLQIDYPRYEGLYALACDRVKIVASYIHGSLEGTNVALQQGVRDAKIIGTNVTGAFRGNIYFDGSILDLIGVEAEWGSQIGPSMDNGIMTGPNAQHVRVIGGGATDTQAAWGICRQNPGTSIQLAAADEHWGQQGSRNF